MSGRTQAHGILYWVAALAIGLIASSAWAMSVDDPCGTWLTANGQGVVTIAQCGDALCGRIVGIRRSAAEPAPTDFQGLSQCGLTIIRNEKPATQDTWLGEITDPRDGASYQAKLWVDRQGDLHLRGFVGISVFGATQVWHPFTGHLSDECRLA